MKISNTWGDIMVNYSPYELAVCFIDDLFSDSNHIEQFKKVQHKNPFPHLYTYAIFTTIEVIFKNTEKYVECYEKGYYNFPDVFNMVIADLESFDFTSLGPDWFIGNSTIYIKYITKSKDPSVILPLISSGISLFDKFIYDILYDKNEVRWLNQIANKCHVSHIVPLLFLAPGYYQLHSNYDFQEIKTYISVKTLELINK